MAPNKGQQGTGNIARQMAAAPTGNVGNGVIAAAIADAVNVAADEIIEEIKSGTASPEVIAAAQAAAAAVNPGSGVEQLRTLFGKPTFRIPDRPGVYPDKKNPARVNRKMASVEFLIGGMLEIDASIYASEETKKGAEGTFLEQTYSVSLPSYQFKAPKSNPLVQLALNEWKQELLDLYESWILTLGAQTPQTRKAADGPRLVKRVQITETATAPAAAAPTAA